jgi:hypothetical protein
MLRVHDGPSMVLPDDNFAACTSQIRNEGSQIFVIDMSFLYTGSTLARFSYCLLFQQSSVLIRIIKVATFHPFDQFSVFAKYESGRDSLNIKQRGQVFSRIINW